MESNISQLCIIDYTPCKTAIDTTPMYIFRFVKFDKKKKPELYTDKQ